MLVLAIIGVLRFLRLLPKPDLPKPPPVLRGELAKQVAAETWNCSECETENSGLAHFCTNCETPLPKKKSKVWIIGAVLLVLFAVLIGWGYMASWGWF